MTEKPYAAPAMTPTVTKARRTFDMLWYQRERERSALWLGEAAKQSVWPTELRAFFTALSDNTHWHNAFGNHRTRTSTMQGDWYGEAREGTVSE
jgi:hypothetical protein